MATWIGIDVSKRQLEIWIEGRVLKVANTSAGFAALLERLRKTQDAHVCVEHTGGYETALASFLHEQGVGVSIVNPAWVHAFAGSLGARHKTDAQDARMLALFAGAIQPPAWEPRAEMWTELRALSLALQDVETQLQALARRAEAPNCAPAVRESLLRLSQAYKQEQKALRAHIAELAAQHAPIRQGIDQLSSICGIAERSAVRILAEIGGEPIRNGRQLAAYAGTVPRHRLSGTSLKNPGGIGRACNPRLRKALYMPALVMIRNSGECRRFYERLLGRNKTKKEAIVAVMRKLTHAIYAVLARPEPYRADLLFGA